ncbi:MAG: hypothetical protein IIC41_03505 [Candidatus Marinimicrobia bacterium]|nr:hypothetical protein [Candidatus Neomarinimicrobiota bacterium]
MLVDHPSLEGLPLQLEPAPQLARWLGLDEVLLVREDQLPGGGGKKRRSLDTLAAGLDPRRPVHVLSYAGSHSAYTLARLLPDTEIVSHGKYYRGGGYQRLMVQRLRRLPNVIQRNGPLFTTLLDFLWHKYVTRRSDTYLPPGGALKRDEAYVRAARVLAEHIDPGYHHVVPMASGNMAAALAEVFPLVTGVLTQPWYIRLALWLRLHRAKGLRLPPLAERERLVRQVFSETGLPLDPVFMGAVLSYVIKESRRLGRVCLWVTCPAAQQFHAG